MIVTCASRRGRRGAGRGTRERRRGVAVAAGPVAAGREGVGKPTLGGRPAAGAATRAGGGPNNDGWPLCLFQASQIRNSETENTTQSKVRRISVMGAVSVEGGARNGLGVRRRARAGR